jgi:metal-responsive CopG/Arc/MetJ family transcriptional regulator
MSHRLQVLIPEDLDARIGKAAQRARVSKGEWVRRAVEAALREKEERGGPRDSLARLASLGGPTGSIEQMLEEIDAGRR